MESADGDLANALAKLAEVTDERDKYKCSVDKLKTFLQPMKVSHQ